jgi:hypothetical protein
MMVRVDHDLARAALIHKYAKGLNDEEPCRHDDETDILCWTPNGLVRISPKKKLSEVMSAAILVPDWLTNLLRDGTTISMTREDFYGLPEEVRRYVEVF